MLKQRNRVKQNLNASVISGMCHLSMASSRVVVKLTTEYTVRIDKTAKESDCTNGMINAAIMI